MEEIPYTSEASLGPERGQLPPYSTHEVDLQDRIRSLLLARNDKRPPKTPCSTPDYAYLSRNPDFLPLGNRIAPQRRYNFASATMTAKPNRIQLLSQQMGATGYDGLASQVHDEGLRKPRQNTVYHDIFNSSKNSTEMRRFSSSGRGLATQTASAGKLTPSKEMLRRSRTVSNSQSRAKAPQISYTLRTVAPKPSAAADQRPHLEHQHIPGSFRSEKDFAALEIPKAKPVVPKTSSDAIPVDRNLEMRSHSLPVKVIDALHQVQDHVNILQGSAPGSIRPEASYGSLQSALPKLFDSKQTAGTQNDPPDASQTIEGAPRNMLSLTVQEDGRPRLHVLINAENPPSDLEIAPNHGLSLDAMKRKVSRELEQGFEEDLTNLPALPKSSDSISSRSSRDTTLGSASKAKAPKSPKELYPQKPTLDVNASSPVSLLSGIDHGQSAGNSEAEPTAVHPSDHRLDHKGSRKLKIVRPTNLEDSLAETMSTDESSSFLRKQYQQTESFTKAIADLESLLKEALDIADQGTFTERKGTEAVTKSVPQADDVENTSVTISETSESVLTDSDIEAAHGSVSMPPGSRNIPPVILVEPDENAKYHGHFQNARDATPFARTPASTRHQSVVPNDVDRVSDAHPSSKEGRKASTDGPHVIIASSDSDRAIKDHGAFEATGWVVGQVPRAEALNLPTHSPSLQVPEKEQHNHLIPKKNCSSDTSQLTTASRSRPPIQTRASSLRRRSRRSSQHAPEKLDHLRASNESSSTSGPYVADFKNSALQYHPIIKEVMDGSSNFGGAPARRPSHPRDDNFTILKETDPQIEGLSHPEYETVLKGHNLRNYHHFSIREPHGFSLSRSHRRAPIARDWTTPRKRFVATVTCINTTLLGLVIGIYAGEVPAIQYTIADEHHYTILGNVVLFLGLAVTTFLFWPLPLLHGRKPYTMGALIFLMLLQFPQALVVASSRDPSVAVYRVGLLVPRALAGLVMGFANINFKTTLLDLFGASLQSGNPHQEIVNENDVRRHGGGMGVWLGIWTWCSIGSISLGFWIGASIISGLNVPWGFWITIIINAFVLLLNVVTPEVRRSPYRRSMAEVRTGTEVSRRIARGEVKMHLDSTGPIWWWEEVHAGLILSFRMLKQPGFAVLSFYMGWIYGQVVLVIVLLGALLSKYYFFHPQFVGLSVAIVALGAIIAMPFQKASLFSRSRHHRQRTDSMTFEKRVTWTSHLVRRTLFMITLPFADLAYTLASQGPPTHYMTPIIFAGLIGFLSNLAIAECNGLIMETFDTSDLQPGMTGRPRRVLPEEVKKKRTNFSCFPRVSAGFAVTHSFAFCIAAGATGWGGVVERHVGAQIATAIMTGVLLLLTLLLTAVLTRRKVVQIIPSERFGTNILTGPEDEWKPIIIGNPSGTTRRISVLELGTLSRWSEIRQRNRLGA